MAGITIGFLRCASGDFAPFVFLRSIPRILFFHPSRFTPGKRQLVKLHWNRSPPNGRQPALFMVMKTRYVQSADSSTKDLPIVVGTGVREAEHGLPTCAVTSIHMAKINDGKKWSLLPVGSNMKTASPYIGETCTRGEPFDSKSTSSYAHEAAINFLARPHHCSGAQARAAGA